MCAKSVLELWGHGKCPEGLNSSLKSYPVEKMVLFLHSDSTYKIKIHTCPTDSETQGGPSRLGHGFN